MIRRIRNLGDFERWMILGICFLTMILVSCEDHENRLDQEGNSLAHSVPGAIYLGPQSCRKYNVTGQPHYIVHLILESNEGDRKGVVVKYVYGRLGGGQTSRYVDYQSASPPTHSDIQIPIIKGYDRCYVVVNFNVEEETRYFVVDLQSLNKDLKFPEFEAMEKIENQADLVESIQAAKRLRRVLSQ